MGYLLNMLAAYVVEEKNSSKLVKIHLVGRIAMVLGVGSLKESTTGMMIFTGEL